MPVYEYRCPECGVKISLVRKMSESKDPVECECGIQMKRIFEPVEFNGFGKWVSSSRKKFNQKHGNDPDKAKGLVDL